MNKLLTILIFIGLTAPLNKLLAQYSFSTIPDSVAFHTEDINTF
jgi:hypothetical protein